MIQKQIEAKIITTDSGMTTVVQIFDDTSPSVYNYMGSKYARQTLGTELSQYFIH